MRDTCQSAGCRKLKHHGKSAPVHPIQDKSHTAGLGLIHEHAELIALRPTCAHYWQSRYHETEASVELLIEHASLAFIVKSASLRLNVTV